MNALTTQNFEKELTSCDFVMGFEDSSSMTAYYIANHKQILGGIAFEMPDASNSSIKYPIHASCCTIP